MKCHTSVDAGSGFVHTAVATSANIHDVTAATAPLREDDEVVYGDSAYLGIEKREEVCGDPRFFEIKFPLIAGQAVCQSFLTTPLAGNVLLRSANPLYAARWSIHTEL